MDDVPSVSRAEDGVETLIEVADVLLLFTA